MNATNDLSFGLLMRGDAVPAQEVLKELFSEIIVGTVNGRTQRRNCWLKVVEMSVDGTKVHSLFDTGASPDTISAKFTVNQSVSP